jgi:hypothetical protein
MFRVRCKSHRHTESVFLICCTKQQKPSESKLKPKIIFSFQPPQKKPQYFNEESEKDKN